MNSFSISRIHVCVTFLTRSVLKEKEEKKRRWRWRKKVKTEREGFILKRVNNAFQMERVRSLPVGSRSILPWCIRPPKVRSIYSFEERGHLYSRAYCDSPRIYFGGSNGSRQKGSISRWVNEILKLRSPALGYLCPCLKFYPFIVNLRKYPLQWMDNLIKV